MTDLFGPVQMGYITWLVDVRGFQMLSAILYAVYCALILKIGFQEHVAKVTGVGQTEVYPPGYFSMLAVALLPLAIAGVARDDAYIIVTRWPTLIVVMIVYASVMNETGVFHWSRYRYWIKACLMASFVLPMVWAGNESLRTLVTSYQTLFSWVAVAAMVVFVIFGQGVTIRELLAGHLTGKYQMKGFYIQTVRLGGFAFQAIHYGMVYGLSDPVFIQGALGAIGATCIMTAYVFKSGYRILFSNQPTLA